MSKLFFTADQHFSHPLMAKLRGFGETPEAVEKMNSTIIARHNERVRKDDVVFVLGDLLVHGAKNFAPRIAPEEFIKQLNGTLVLLSGNHDSNNGVPAFIKSAQIEYGGMSINMTHRPEDYNQDYPINLTAHVHSLWKTRTLIDHTVLVNVGVDAWRYRPIDIQEIRQAIIEEAKIQLERREQNKKQKEEAKTIKI